MIWIRCRLGFIVIFIWIICFLLQDNLFLFRHWILESWFIPWLCDLRFVGLGFLTNTWHDFYSTFLSFHLSSLKIWTFGAWRSSWISSKHWFLPLDQEERPTFSWGFIYLGDIDLSFLILDFHQKGFEFLEFFVPKALSLFTNQNIDLEIVLNL